MKKAVFLMLAVLISLCTFSLAFCKGEITDLDAFETYIGKTREEIRLIQPNTFTIDDDEDVYYVDGSTCNDDGIMLMAVQFDEKTGKANSVSLLVTGCSDLELEGNPTQALVLGFYVLGLDPQDIEDLEEKDGSLYATLKNDVVCSTTESDLGGDAAILTGCVQF